MNVSIAWQWGLKMCDVFFNPVSSTLNQCSWKHMYSSNIKNPWVEGVQEPGSCMHSIFSSTHDFNLANGPPVPNQRKFNILNHPCWLTVYAGLAEPHGDKSCRWVNQVCIQRWWNAFPLRNEGHCSKSGSQIKIFLKQLKNMLLSRSLS